MDDARARLLEIVGEDCLTDSPDIAEAFSLNRGPLEYTNPSLKVRPRTVEEVQKIARWANGALRALVPVSSGAPHFRGDTVPGKPEAIIVDLSGMKRILKINRRNRLALIEPGVTFSQLVPELEKEGLRLSMPLLPRGNKSVLTSLLEREPLTSPKYQWNLLEPLRSLEIVWGSGERLYSGSGVFRGEKEEDWQKGRVPVWGPGPGQLDFYKFVSAAQGSMGMVTWASVKCEVLPQARRLFFVPAERLDDLIEFTYRLLKFRFGEELFIVNGACLAYMLAPSSEEVESLRPALPAWTAVVGISGGRILAAERVESQEADIRDIAQEFGLEMAPAILGCQGNEFLELLRAPSGEPCWKLGYKGNVQELFFLTTLDRTPGFAATMNKVSRQRRYPVSDIGVYVQPVHQGVACHCEFILPFSRDSEPEVKATGELLREGSSSLFRQGAYFSRPYGMWAEMVFNADEATTKAIRKIKKIFDPNNVMNPGKLCF